MATGRKIVIEFAGKDNAGAAVAKVVRQLDGVKTRLEALNRTDASPEVKADTVAALTRLGEVQEKLQGLNGQEATPEVRAQAADAQLALDRIKQTMREIDGRVLNVDVDVDTAAASTKLELFKAKMRGVSGGLRGALGTLANVPFAGSLLANPYTILPFLAAAGGAIAVAANVALSLGTAIGAAAGGAVALKLALSNLHLTQAGRDFADFEKHLKGIKREFQRMAQSNILPGLQAGIKSALGGLGGSARGAFAGITKGLGDEFARLGRQLGNDPNIKRFLHIIGKQAPAAFRNLGDIAFHTVGIITKVFNAFSTGKGKSDPLKSLAGSVRRFNQSLNPSKVKRFAEDVRGVAKAFGFVAKWATVGVRILWGAIGRAIDAMVHWRQTWSSLKGAVARAWGAITSATSRAWAAVRSFVARGIHGVNSDVSNGLSNVVGFFRSLPGRIVGAVGNLGGLLVAAGRSVIQGLINGVESMVGALTSKLHSITSLIPAHKGPLKKDLALLRPAGRAIMRGLIDGINHGWKQLSKVLDKVTQFVERHGAKLRRLVENRKGVISSFRGMSSSVFGQDLSTESVNGVARQATSGSLVAYQKAQAAKAHRLVQDLRKLRKAGISDNLLRQMVSAGESGWDNLHALATGPASDVKALNRANAATNAALTDAGQMTAQSLGYGPGAIRHERRLVEQGKQLAHVLKKIDKHLDDNSRTVIEVHLDGRVLRSSLVRLKRTSGKNLGLA